MTNGEYRQHLQSAVKHFWRTRKSQLRKQGVESGRRDRGSRAAVTGGKQMDGFVSLVRQIVITAGIPVSCIYERTKVELPGYFRPEKKWDIVIVDNGILLATIEFKSHIGSFGNNFNNRSEEAVGNASDLWTAYREGAFKPSPRPWLGYLMLIEESERSTSPINVREPHFNVFEELRLSSYAKRYEILLTKLIRERLYDSTCFITSNETNGLRGDYKEPSSELAFENFVASLLGKLIGYLQTRK